MLGDIDDNELLFDRELIGERERKKPETEDEKELQEIRWIRERNLQNLRNRVKRGESLTAAQERRLEEYEKKLEAAGTDFSEYVVRNRREVAEYFEKNIRTIHRWAKRGMPELPDGYDLDAIETWAVRQGLIQKRKIKEGGNGDKGSTESTGEIDYKQENEKLKLKIKQFEFDQRLGQFISREDVERENITKITIVKRALLAQPRAVAPRLVGLEAREIEALLMEHNRDIMRRFAQGEG